MPKPIRVWVAPNGARVVELTPQPQPPATPSHPAPVEAPSA